MKRGTGATAGRGRQSAPSSAPPAAHRPRIGEAWDALLNTFSDGRDRDGHRIRPILAAWSSLMNARVTPGTCTPRSWKAATWPPSRRYDVQNSSPTTWPATPTNPRLANERRTWSATRRVARIWGRMMHKADFDLLSGVLCREHRHAEMSGNRTDVQRVEHTVLTIAEALAAQNRSFLPVTWILDSCGVRSVSQLTAGSRRDIQERFGTTRREIPVRPGDRSKQARALAHAIAGRVGVNRWDVGAQYVDERTGYRITWTNGPTWRGMRDLTDELMATGRYPALAGTHLDLQRNTGPRAWAARVVAAYREETLWEPVEREAARIRASTQGWASAPASPAGTRNTRWTSTSGNWSTKPSTRSEPATRPTNQ